MSVETTKLSKAMRRRGPGLGRHHVLLWAVVLVFSLLAAACSDSEDEPPPGTTVTGGTHGGGSTGAGGTGAGGTGASGGTTGSGWPAGNEYAWDGSWSPAPGDFPLSGLLDDEYHDGHADGQGDPTPILPPGEWDWDDGNDDLANWRNFRDNIGSFEPLSDGAEHQFGWRLVGTASDIDYSGPAEYFEGSSGTDLLDLGPGGQLHSYGAGQLADGPDELVFDRSWSLDFRTGSTSTGAARDNDLVIAGCGSNPDGSFDIETTSVHTGPGSDWVFIRDWSRAGVDLGNGDDGNTSVLDPSDGDDLVVVRGNAHDFRVMGGSGDDVAVWYVDEHVQTQQWLGPNFFGGGGWSDAVWADDGTDRLVLVVPTDTIIVEQPPTPVGALLILATDGQLVDDAPTAGDPYAHYCVECGTSPTGRKTVILEYRSADDAVFTGYFFVTAFEVLQLGVGSGATVYEIDDVAGSLSERSDLEAFEPPVPPASYCQ